MLNEKIIKALEDRGFKRWTKHGKDRLYVDADVLGMDASTYKYRGERVSNNVAREMLGTKTYVDVETGMVSSGSWTLKRDVEILIENLDDEIEMKELPKSEATPEKDEVEIRAIERRDNEVAKIMQDITVSDTDESEIEQAAEKMRVDGVYIPYGPNPNLCHLISLCNTICECARAAKYSVACDHERFVRSMAEMRVLQEIRADRFGI